MNQRELEDLSTSFIVLLMLFSNFEIKLMPYVAVAVVTAFVFHELAHRQVARHFGYIAFYRRWNVGIALALLIGIATRVLTGSAWIFAALGAVYIYSYPSYLPPSDGRRSNGIIAAAGPLTNIVVGAVALAVVKGVGLSAVPGDVLRMTAKVNLWLAFFNLWPIPPLDGFKVLRWNVGYWAVMIGVAYLLSMIPI
ncbi:MAG: metalloprotease [Thermococci archaeon]|nr:metalloprotease [Thermococci archaeon]